MHDCRNGRCGNSSVAHAAKLVVPAGADDVTVVLDVGAVGTARRRARSGTAFLNERALQQQELQPLVLLLRPPEIFQTGHWRTGLTAVMTHFIAAVPTAFVSMLMTWT
jgi:hypothetical protein